MAKFGDFAVAVFVDVDAVEFGLFAGGGDAGRVDVALVVGGRLPPVGGAGAVTRDMWVWSTSHAVARRPQLGTLGDRSAAFVLVQWWSR
jgi:hypothetical protein